jgi:hypothetical protein
VQVKPKKCLKNAQKTPKKRPKNDQKTTKKRPKNAQKPKKGERSTKNGKKNQYKISARVNF